MFYEGHKPQVDHKFSFMVCNNYNTTCFIKLMALTTLIQEFLKSTVYMKMLKYLILRIFYMVVERQNSERLKHLFLFIPLLLKYLTFYQCSNNLQSSKAKIIISLEKAAKYSKLQLWSLFDKYNMKPLSNTFILKN